MLAVAERRATAARVAVTFIRDDAHELRFGDRSFDSVICLRVLMHTPDWRKALAELCRVARHSVVFDYPALRSAAALQAAARRVGHAAGIPTEAYRVFSDRSVRTALAAAGFRVARVHRQFVLPIALHKAVGSAAATTRIEGGLAALGLQRLLGSPVTVLAERCTS
jgi:2-polyprenyl-3-methyl-5-hydroxy-6-metoxy-1,4-benzoquinol methylase